MHFINAVFATLPLATLVKGAPISDSDSASNKPYVAVITGLPNSSFPEPVYVAYQPNFFGELALDTTTEKNLAVNWTINHKSDLVSTTKQTIALTPPNSATPQNQALSYVKYNGTQGTYVKSNKQVVNHKHYFSSWQVCTSQYGLSLLYYTPGYNGSSTGIPVFPCYPVKFVLQQ